MKPQIRQEKFLNLESEVKFSISSIPYAFKNITNMKRKVLPLNSCICMDSSVPNFHIKLSKVFFIHKLTSINDALM
jgi:hypothetical protein